MTNEMKDTWSCNYGRCSSQECYRFSAKIWQAGSLVCSNIGGKTFIENICMKGQEDQNRNLTKTKTENKIKNNLSN